MIQLMKAVLKNWDGRKAEGVRGAASNVSNLRPEMNLVFIRSPKHFHGNQKNKKKALN